MHPHGEPERAHKTKGTRKTRDRMQHQSGWVDGWWIARKSKGRRPRCTVRVYSRLLGRIIGVGRHGNGDRTPAQQRRRSTKVMLAACIHCDGNHYSASTHTNTHTHGKTTLLCSWNRFFVCVPVAVCLKFARSFAQTQNHTSTRTRTRCHIVVYLRLSHTKETPLRLADCNHYTVVFVCTHCSR